MRTKTMNGFIISLTALTLCGCGGGGSDNEDTGPSNTFPLAVGYKKRMQEPASENYKISGTCSGSAILSKSSPSSTIFENTPTLKVTQTFTTQFDNCTPTTTASTTVGFYNSNYDLLGSSTGGNEYTVVSGTAAEIPSTVKIGDNSVYGTFLVYADKNKNIQLGHRELSYTVQPGSNTYATVIFITRNFNTSNQLLWTQQSKYRIMNDGTFTPVSIDIQYSTTSTNHLVFTKR
ncbi:MAG: hypothetical protein RLY71_1632 [Pseudomonadota bacterium]|jgi:hypothetical protein